MSTFIVENEVSGRMIRDLFVEAENSLKHKSHKHSAEHAVISFYEEMRRRHWIEGERSDVFDSLISLKLSNTLGISCTRKGLMTEESYERIKIKLVQRATRAVQSAIFDKSCVSYCHFLKYVLIKS